MPKLVSKPSRSKEQARDLLKSIGLLKNYRIIQGEEREKVFTMLHMIPSTHSNNQRCWCETWEVGNITYNHYTGSELDDLEEVTDE